MRGERESERKRAKKETVTRWRNLAYAYFEACGLSCKHCSWWLSNTFIYMCMTEELIEQDCKTTI